MIVADASLIGAFILKEEGWEDYAIALENVLTVDHAIKEVSNAIWKAYNRGYIVLEDAKTKFEALKKFFSKNLTMFPETELLDRAMEIALSQKIPIYDSLYIALALRKGYRFSSLDETQLGIARKLGVPLYGQPHLRADELNRSYQPEEADDRQMGEKEVSGNAIINDGIGSDGYVTNQPQDI